MAVRVDPNDFTPMDVPVEFTATKVEISDDGEYSLIGPIKLELGSRWVEGHCIATIARDESGIWNVVHMSIVPNKRESETQ